MKLLCIVLSETEMRGEVPLYEAIVRKMNHLGLAGATVIRGMMGFGSGHHVHRERLFGVSDDRPITIFCFDDEAKIRAALHDLRTVSKHVLIAMVDAEYVP